MPSGKGDEGGCKIWKGRWQKMAIFARGGQDALYPARSGEWEVPVTRNAKITPVNEGGWGASPPGSPLVGSPVTRNAEIDPPPPPKMTQGVMTPLTPFITFNASLSGVARCWHSNAYFSLFSSLFFFDPPNRFVQIPSERVQGQYTPEQRGRCSVASEKLVRSESDHDRCAVCNYSDAHAVRLI